MKIELTCSGGGIQEELASISSDATVDRGAGQQRPVTPGPGCVKLKPLVDGQSGLNGLSVHQLADLAKKHEAVNATRASPRSIAQAPLKLRVNGVWSEWSAWDSCASDCSKVKEYRNRACDNPRPKHAGSLCDGATQEERDCTSEAACPGAWAIWGVWSPCHSASGSCGLGTGSKQRNRTCSNPPPRNGGPDCEGNEDQSTGCDVTCPAYDVGEFNGPLQYEQSWAHCSNTHHVTNFATAASTREGINALVMFCNDPAQTRLVSWTSYGAGNLAPAMTDCPSGYTKAKAMIVQVRIIAPRSDQIHPFVPEDPGPCVGQALQEWLRFFELFYRANYLSRPSPPDLEAAALSAFKDQAKRDVLLWAVGPFVQDDLELKITNPTAETVTFVQVTNALRKAFRPVSAPH
eukprot:maker-scaffold376_size191502-snap-gene-0.26 protein:Tk10505 transcript:maker-scaffold376_size191502-snap-gene-0.26-mRNA-1 annotation:"hypothetical protein BRAFLDRAFT_67461"